MFFSDLREVCAKAHAWLVESYLRRKEEPAPVWMHKVEANFIADIHINYRVDITAARADVADVRLSVARAEMKLDVDVKRFTIVLSRHMQEWKAAVIIHLN